MRSATDVSIHFCLRFAGDSCCLGLAGFGSASEFCSVVVKESRGCRDASVSDSHLVLAFEGRLESWDLQKEEKAPSWRMEMQTESTGMELDLNGVAKALWCLTK